MVCYRRKEVQLPLCPKGQDYDTHTLAPIPMPPMPPRPPPLPPSSPRPHLLRIINDRFVNGFPTNDLTRAGVLQGHTRCTPTTRTFH